MHRHRNIIYIMENIKKVGLLTKMMSLEGVQDNKFYHPEKNVLHHSLQAYELSLQFNNEDLMLAALFHDIGKVEDTLKHAAIGAEILRDAGMSKKVVWLVENHMRMFYFIDMRFGKKLKLINHIWFGDLCRLLAIDRCARKENAKVTPLHTVFNEFIY